MSKSRAFPSLLLYLLVLSVTGLSAQESAREWTDVEGRKVRATLTGFADPATIILKLEDGRSVNLPLARLSAGDATYAQERGRAMATSGNEAPAAAGVDWTQPKLSTDYVIRGVKRETVPGYISVKSGWEYRLRSIEARLEYKGSLEAAKASVKAYYFNRNGQQIDKFERPPRRQDENGVYVTMPELFARGKTVEVYYPITEFHEEADLATVLVVFGEDDQYSAEALPKVSFEKLDFPEKARLFPGWTPADPATTGTSASDTALTVEVRRPRKERHRFSVVFDGGYKDGKNVIAAEVRAAGPITPGEGVAKLYAFDAEGKRVGFRNRPSTASVGGGTYVGVPKVANDSWLPVFFALDGDLAEEPPTYVVVFSFGGKTAAAVTSSRGATLESLDFPEKAELSK